MDSDTRNDRPVVATVRAYANIALAKYWGKIDAELNLPAVPSISLTLDALRTDTRLTLDSELATDVITIDGTAQPTERSADAIDVLTRVRARAGSRCCARVESTNHFPTASGLASSASGFAALVTAAAQAYGAALTSSERSAIARRGSASAARSIFGGWVELPAGAPGDDSLAARPFAPAAHWDVAMVIAIVSREAKKVSSRRGMSETSRTSPYYPPWLANAPLLAREVRDGVLARDLARVGEAMEASTAAMHASAWAARPSIRYALPASLELLAEVERLRATGTAAYATMDAGPHVKVLCARVDEDRVSSALRTCPGVLDVLIAHAGEDAA